MPEGIILGVNALNILKKFIIIKITTPFLVDCKNDKIVFPDKEQEYKTRLKEKIGEEEIEGLTASDRIVQYPENLEKLENRSFINLYNKRYLKCLKDKI